jgi:hypothetical protein
MTRAVLASLLALPLLVAACGGGHGSATPGFVACADAWNAAGNAHDRATVAQLVHTGYTRAGIGMNVSGGSPSQKSDPNPVGCRLVVFNDRRWFAYLAKRDGERFVFRSGRPQYIADQSGAWPRGSTPGPDNARVSLRGEVAVAVDRRGRPVVAPAWKAVLDDFVDDGHVNRPHSCAAVRAAIAHLPPSDRTPSDRTLGRAEGRYC